MKVALVIEGLGSGGAERVACTLGELLFARGFDVTLLTIDAETGKFYTPPASCELYDLGLKKIEMSLSKRIIGYHFIRLKKLKEALLKINPNLIIPFGTKLNGLVLLALGEKSRDIPVIITERGDPKNGRIEWTYKLLRKITYPKASTMVCLTRYAADFWSKSVPSLPTYVVPNPVSFVIQEDTGEISKGNGKNIILSVGRLARQKNYPLLLKAFSLIAAEYPDWDLIVYGEGKKREELIRLSKRLGISERVFFPGVTKNIAEAYKRADIYVQSSLYEGFCNTLVEAMGFGLPVIATDWNGVEDIILDGKNGLVVPFDVKKLAEAISTLISNEELRQNLGKEAKKIKHKFSLEKFGEKWYRLIQDVLKQKKLTNE
ncbi:glycosyltransferase family 4 protein [Thermovirga sp.]|uniref:glycosyltransferase family 4 protein n=1 Tax=Thermovirga sp. TaxID=2699834 RepID=UPI0025F2B358|nr:glycosyltransferase family 4 protein [Thermovirga sp.]MBO8154591.1 glycosyltransferase family 4 protein [Thermovirga sp.]